MSKDLKTIMTKGDKQSGHYYDIYGDKKMLNFEKVSWVLDLGNDDFELEIEALQIVAISPEKFALIVSGYTPDAYEYPSYSTDGK